MAVLLNATMLYRSGISEKIHGVAVDWIIVDASDVDEMLADGWFRTPADVQAALTAEREQSAKKGSK